MSDLAEALDEIRAALQDPARLVRAVAAGRRHGQPHPAWRRVDLRWIELAAGRRLSITRYSATQAFTSNVVEAAAPETIAQLLAEPYANWHLDLVGETIALRVAKKGRPFLHRAPGALGGAVPGGSPTEIRDVLARRAEAIGSADNAPAESSAADNAPAESSAADNRPGVAGDGGSGSVAVGGGSAHAARSAEHDRVKPVLLPLSHPVLLKLGITDAAGRVKPSRHGKHRQAEQFLRALEPVLPVARRAAGADALRVVDLGCGNAYLTLIAFAWLSEVWRLDVEMVGVDVRSAARAHNAAIVTELGWSNRVRFIEATIADVAVPADPHLVLALHACDTATDDALARGVRWRAPVILAAPCCHHDVQVQLSSVVPPTGYGLLMRHAILGERLGDLLTDALRAAVLRRHGYRVDVVEFVESTHTARNVLLRAVWTDAPVTERMHAEYAALVGQWGLRPALARLLAEGND